MPDLFVDSASGNDTAGGGDTAATALRSITYAIQEAARRFGGARVAIRLAPGLYSSADREVFPLELAQSMSLLGAGIGRSIVRYERTLTSGYELAISGGEELADFTLQGLPLNPTACYVSEGILQTLGTTHIHDLAIELAPGAAPGEVAFGTGIDIKNDALIERVTVEDCEYGISLASTGFRLTRCTVRNAQRYGVAAYASGGQVRDCDFVGNHWALNLWAEDLLAADNRFDNNVRCIGVGGGQSTPSIIRGNDMRGSFEGVVLMSGAQVIDNDILTEDGGIALLVGSGSPPGLATSSPNAIRPEIRNNRLQRTGPTPTYVLRPLVGIAGGARPVFENNQFTTDGNAFGFMTVHENAVPDLGYPPDGLSLGRNNFQAGWIVFYQAGSPRKTVRAHNNYWRNVPVTRGFNVSHPRDWYVDPPTRRGSVILDTTGAM